MTEFQAITGGGGEIIEVGEVTERLGVEFRGSI